VKQGPRDEAAIRTPDRRLRVFVSSTLGELAEERRSVGRAVSALRLTPVMLEAGARPYPPAEVYRAYLAQADVFIGCTSSGTGSWSRARRSRVWRRSSTCRPGCRGCCMSRGRRRIVSRGWRICWPGSRRSPRRPTGISALRRSWAGCCVMTWRCCSASGSPPLPARPRLRRRRAPVGRGRCR
jgi:Domain of unknown function (DUF4062)